MLGVALAADWEGRFDAGAEVGRSSIGVVDAVVKKGPWSAALYTDTVDLRYAPVRRGGRAWVGLRTSTFAAGMLLVRWKDGAPAPEREVRAGYVGPDAGVLWYLPRGFYAGAGAEAHLWWFYADAQRPMPVLTAEAIGGWWKPWGQAELRAGTDLDGNGWMPRARLSGQILRPEGWSPYLAVHAGVADNQSRLTRTRLGGLSPYFVPLAGAVIAEFRVENYAAARIGPAWSGKSVRVAAFADTAVWDDGRAVGFGAMTHVSRGNVFADLSVGYSPWLPRQTGIAVGGWAVVGWQGRLGRETAETARDVD